MTEQDFDNILTFQAEIIPENFRKKLEEAEKSKEMEDLYLPPRSRKTLQQINQSGEGERRADSITD